MKITLVDSLAFLGALVCVQVVASDPQGLSNEPSSSSSPPEAGGIKETLTNEEMQELIANAKMNPQGNFPPPPQEEDEEGGKKEKKKKRTVNKTQKKKKKSTKDWSKLNVDEMSLDWEDGDEEEELEHEYERIQRIAEEKAKRASKVMQSGTPKDIKKVVESGALDTKGGMVFLTLQDVKLDGEAWDMPFQADMCARWTALLKTASLQANIYNMEPGQVLLQVDKGWMFNDVMKFVMQQPEVVKGYKDGKDYLPSQYVDDDEL